MLALSLGVDILWDVRHVSIGVDEEILVVDRASSCTKAWVLTRISLLLQDVCKIEKDRAIWVLLLSVGLISLEFLLLFVVLGFIFGFFFFIIHVII